MAHGLCDVEAKSSCLLRGNEDFKPQPSLKVASFLGAKAALKPRAVSYNIIQSIKKKFFRYFQHKFHKGGLKTLHNLRRLKCVASSSRSSASSSAFKISYKIYLQFNVQLHGLKVVKQNFELSNFHARSNTNKR